MIGVSCEHCGSNRLEEAWRRHFNLRENGWEGCHIFWHCRECGRRGYIVKDIVMYGNTTFCKTD